MRARRVRHEDWHLFGEANVDNGTMAEDGMFAVVANHVHGIHISVRSKDRLELVPVEASGAGDEKGGWRPGGPADDGGNARLEGPGCISGGGDNLERCTIADGVACQKIGVLVQRINNHRLHDAGGTLDGCRIPVANREKRCVEVAFGGEGFSNCDLTLSKKMGQVVWSILRVVLIARHPRKLAIKQRLPILFFNDL